MVCARCLAEVTSALDGNDVSDASPQSSQACIKCKHQQLRGSFACEKCGLRFALAASLPQGYRSDGLPDTHLSTVLRQQWADIESKPDIEAVHYKFIDLCQTSGHIDFAGLCYRKALHDSLEQDAQLWQHYQQRVIQRAMVVLGTSRKPNERDSRLFPLFMLVLGAILILGLAYLYYHWSQSSADMLQNAL